MRHYQKIELTNWIIVVIAGLLWACIIGGVGL